MSKGKVVVYNHYGYAAYLDGKLVGSSYSGTANERSILLAMGYEYECRGVSSLDWPTNARNANSSFSSGYNGKAPDDIETVERHYAELDRRAKEARLANLEREVGELRRELSR